MARRSKNTPYPTAPVGFFTLHGELAYGFGAYAVTVSGQLYSYHSHQYNSGSYSAQQGVSVVIMTPDGKFKTSLHRLVAQYFIPSEEGKNLVEHLDGNKRNNKKENLRWISSQYVQGKVVIWKNSPCQRKGISLQKNGTYKVTCAGVYMKCFQSLEVASLVYNERAKELGFQALNPVDLPGVV